MKNNESKHVMHAWLMNTTWCLEWSGFLSNLPRYMISLPVLLIYSYCAEKEPNRAIVIAIQSKCNQIKNRYIFYKADPTTFPDKKSMLQKSFICGQIIQTQNLISYFSIVFIFV